MTSSPATSSPTKELNAVLKSNVTMLNQLMTFVDEMLSHSSGEEDTVALCSLRQHEQFPALSGLKRIRSQCAAEMAYHDRLSSGEVPLDPFVKSTNAAHLAALFRFLRLCKPDQLTATYDDSRVLAGVLQAIHFKPASEVQTQEKPSWSGNDDDNLIHADENDENDDCAYASDGDDTAESFTEFNTFNAVENILVEGPDQPESGDRPPLVVDIQAFQGHVWLKAIARNPRSLLRAARGECEFGEKAMLTYASDYTEASQLRPIHHRNPFLIFFFEFGLTAPSSESSPEKNPASYPVVAEQLLGAGVLPAVAAEKYEGDDVFQNTIVMEAARKVHICSFCRLSLADVFEQLLKSAGAVPLLPNEVTSQSDLDVVTEWLRSRFGEKLVAPPSIPSHLDALQSVDIKNGVNLDVSCLLVLVSNLTNGRCEDALFASNRHRALREQAANERKRPVLSEQLGPFFAKRPNIVLYCSETALKSFNDIVRILAGPCEKGRAEMLRQRLIVLPDVMSARVDALPESVNVKPRAKVIFGFGDAYRLVTLTANAAFIRAALYHAGGVLGHQLAVYLHPSRALSEQKEEISYEQQKGIQMLSPDMWIQQLLGGENKISRKF